MSSPSTMPGYGLRQEPILQEDWLNGVIPHRDLILPVVVARNELQGLSHIQALSIWIHFYGAAKEWQTQSGAPTALPDEPAIAPPNWQLPGQ